jgi:hypothetical protein
MIENGGAILRACIRALTVERGGIMNGKEDIQQVMIGNDARVEVDLHDFGVPCISVADCPVGWVVDMAASIARLHAMHAFDLVKNSFETPEASPSQCCGLKIVVHMITPFWFTQ